MSQLRFIFLFCLYIIQYEETFIRYIVTYYAIYMFVLCVVPFITYIYIYIYIYICIIIRGNITYEVLRILDYL